MQTTKKKKFQISRCSLEETLVLKVTYIITPCRFPYYIPCYNAIKQENKN